MAGTAAPLEAITLLSDDTLRWYEPTDDVAYGFCGECGSSLFWRSDDRPDVWTITAGTLDQPTGLTTTTALFTDDAGDYHRLDESLVQYPRDSH